MKVQFSLQMSAGGQNAKYSSRVDIFRFVSKLSRHSVRSALRICARTGRDLWWIKIQLVR
jgi:hypothetical protein